MPRLFGFIDLKARRPSALAAAGLAWWRRLSLVRQFALAAVPLITIGFGITGNWMGQRVKNAVLDGEAAAIALMVDSIVKPLSQELVDRQQLSAETSQRLKSLLWSDIDSRIVLFKLWRFDGTVVFSDKTELIGQKFSSTDNFQRALEGRIVSAYETAPHESDYRDRRPHGAILEVYAPIRADTSNKVIAIAEYYIANKELESEVGRAVAWSWLLLAGVSAAITASLLAIVHAGSQTIERQHADLERQIVDLEQLSQSNRSLIEQVSSAQLRSATINERVLRRIGADLHDGPAQLLSYALLFSPAADDSASKSRREETALRVRTALTDALRDIRAISAGLLLPEMSSASLAEVVQAAIQMHTSLTNTKVASTISILDTQVPDRVKVSTYRFVQEALTNAYKHAGGRGQSVRAVCEGDQMLLEVSDQGPGLQVDHNQRHNEGLGLIGLRDRIENLGGHFEFRSSPSGSTLSARFNLKQVWQADVGDVGRDHNSSG